MLCVCELGAYDSCALPLHENSVLGTKKSESTDSDFFCAQNKGRKVQTAIFHKLLKCRENLCV